jgi:fumarate reductase subunit C
MLWFLVEIGRAHGGPGAYHPHLSLAFVIFSLVCLAFALWHSVTFLRLSGLIVRIPLGQRTLPASAIVVGSFGLFLLATVVVGGLLILGGR